MAFAFRETDEAAAEITRLFEFVWPTAVALWNMRWQVEGFLAAVPNASYDDVASRFVAGSDIRGADIRSMSRHTTWEDQKERFAEFVLTNIFAIYEGWGRRIFRRSGVSTMSDRDLYNLGDGQNTGLSAFISNVNSNQSAIMKATFEPYYLTHKKVFILQQDSMLKCYKYFKEIRNCNIHNAGIADSRAVAAYAAFHPVSSAGSLKTKAEIEHRPAILGNRTPLSLRGVVGFCDIVLRLMITVDAQLSGTKLAEDEAIARFRSVDSGNVRTLKGERRKAALQIASLCRKASLPTPAAGSIDGLRDWLLQHRLVSL